MIYKFEDEEVFIILKAGLEVLNKVPSGQYSQSLTLEEKGNIKKVILEVAEVKNADRTVRKRH